MYIVAKHFINMIKQSRSFFSNATLCLAYFSLQEFVLNGGTALSSLEFPTLGYLN